MDRKVEVPLHEILDFLWNADHLDKLDFNTIANWTGFVSDEEIKDYADELYGLPPTEEYMAIINFLKAWRNQCCKKL